MHNERQSAHPHNQRFPALQALQRRQQWVCWRSEMRSGRCTKVPYSPRTERRAASNDPATWSSYHQAVTAWERHPQCYDGIGYMFHRDIVGVDLDHCVGTSGQIEPWAQGVLTQLASYAEYSPSGTGIHVLLWGTLPKGIRLPLPSSWPHDHPNAVIEIYGQGRYFTVTGRQVEGTPTIIEARQEALDAFYAELMRTRATPSPGSSPGVTPPTIIPDDEKLLQKAMAAGNGEKFRALFAGEATGYLSASEADLALCVLLAFWTGRDYARMDRLFRQSGLLRDKWESRRGASTYGEQTIQKAIALCQAIYGQNAREASHASEG